MGKMYRKHWMEDKDRDKLIKIAHEALQELRSNPDKFFNFSFAKQEGSVEVFIESTVDLMRLIEDLRQITKMLRKV